jgi:predicted secreted hydrolase
MRRRPLIAALLPGGLALRTAALQAAPRQPKPTPGVAAPPALSADAAPHALGVTRRPLVFPADHGAHPDTRTEWWYVTGWLRGATPADVRGSLPAADARPEFGFQITFFRTRTGLAATSASRFAARQVVFAHLALTDLAAGTLLHDQRAAREGFGLARTPAASGEQVVLLGDWLLARRAAGPAAPSTLEIDARSERFSLRLALAGTQPVMLQGEAGYSRKGALPGQASHYYSEPQLALRGHLERADAPAREVVGRAWLDHEWSDEYLPAEASGWDWIGMNLADGSALMAFRMRRADGSALWAGGSFRDAAGTLRAFGPGEVAFRPLRRWTSPRTRIAYPVEFDLETPAGRFRVAALQDDQELDSRGSTGAVYWEGLAELRRADGPHAGWGYLELTGYGDRLKL